jgi:hypothetical protein
MVHAPNGTRAKWYTRQMEQAPNGTHPDRIPLETIHGSEEEFGNYLHLKNINIPLLKTQK